jgi:hypothetical protein
LRTATEWSLAQVHPNPSYQLPVTDLPNGERQFRVVSEMLRMATMQSPADCVSFV